MKHRFGTSNLVPSEMLVISEKFSTATVKHPSPDRPSPDQKKDRTSLISDFRYGAGILLLKSRGCRNFEVNFRKPRRNLLQRKNVSFGPPMR